MADKVAVMGPSSGAEAGNEAYPPTPKMKGYFSSALGQSSTGGVHRTDSAGTVDRIRQGQSESGSKSGSQSGTGVGFGGALWWPSLFLVLLLALLTACEPLGEVDDLPDVVATEDAGPNPEPDAAPAPYVFKLPLAVYVDGALPVEIGRYFTYGANTLDGSNRTTDGVFGWVEWGDDGSPRLPCDRLDVASGPALKITVEGCRYVVEMPPGVEPEQVLRLVADDLGVELGGAL